MRILILGVLIAIFFILTSCGDENAPIEEITCEKVNRKIELVESCKKEVDIYCWSGNNWCYTDQYRDLLKKCDSIEDDWYCPED